jgi:hypothetical protein
MVLARRVARFREVGRFTAAAALGAGRRGTMFRWPVLARLRLLDERDEAAAVAEVHDLGHCDHCRVLFEDICKYDEKTRTLHSSQRIDMIRKTQLLMID